MPPCSSGLGFSLEPLAPLPEPFPVASGLRNRFKRGSHPARPCPDSLSRVLVDPADPAACYKTQLSVSITRLYLRFCRAAMGLWDALGSYVRTSKNVYTAH